MLVMPSHARLGEMKPKENAAGTPAPGASRSPDTGVFSAVFDQLALVDILQMLHQARRSATVVVRDRGAIFFERGELQHAQAGRLTGREALTALLSIEGGDVQVEAFQPSPQTFNGTFQGILLDTLAKLDEVRAGVEVPSSPNVRTESAGTGAFEWGPATPAIEAEDRSAEAFDAMLDFEFVDQGEPAVPAATPPPVVAQVVVPPPRVASQVAARPLPSSPSATPRPAPSWTRPSDARRGPTQTYKVPTLMEPVVEIQRPTAPQAAGGPSMGVILAVGVVCMLLGLGVAAMLWGPGSAPSAREAAPIETAQP